MWPDQRYVGGRGRWKKLIPVALVLLFLALAGFAAYLLRDMETLRGQKKELEGKVAVLTAETERLAAEVEEKEAELAAVPEPEPEPEPEQEGPGYDAELPPYSELYPDFYAPEPYHATKKSENTVFLTFDDGPSNRTDEILRTLAQEDVKATFFVVGKKDEKNLQRMKNIVGQGHAIGMHSWSHEYKKVYASVEAFLDEMYQVFVMIRDTTGVTPTLFRCPGGSINGYNGGIYQEIIAEMMRRGFVPFDWNVSGEDAVSKNGTPRDKIIDYVMKESEGVVRAVVLLHDTESKTTTAEAVGPIIRQLREKGFVFDKLSADEMPVLLGYKRNK